MSIAEQHILHPLIQELLDGYPQDTRYDIGYPRATDLPYPALDAIMTGFALNNYGDPWSIGALHHSTKAIEQQVIETVGDILGAPSGRWGYVTTGSTQGIEHALMEAARTYPGVVVYTSTAAHDSVLQCADKLRLDYVPIRADDAGRIELADLEAEIRRRRHRPVCVVATAGTTASEAIDDVAGIRQIIEDLALTRWRLNVDAALSGIPLALLPAHERPACGFPAGATSMVISGHKFLGTLHPCAVLIYAQPPAGAARSMVRYTGTADTTATGSRSGHMPVVLWHQLTRLGVDGHRTRAEQARELASYLHEQLSGLGWEAYRNPHAMTVVLRRPPAQVWSRWHLAPLGRMAHVVCVPGVTRPQIDLFLTDMHDAIKPTARRASDAKARAGNR